MSKALTGVYSKRFNYYNPVTKIQSLIHNLDAELITLCKQCSLPKSVGGSNKISTQCTVSTTSRSREVAGVNLISNATSNSTAVKPSSSGVAITTDAQKRQLRNTYRSRVIDAYRNRRIFTVYGNYSTVRRALYRRGWIEKLPASRHARLQTMSEDALLEHARRGNDYEAVVLSKMINNFPSFFIWQAKMQPDMFSEVKPFRNRVRRSKMLDFSTKVGLVGCAEQERWFHEDGVCGMSYPRFYRIVDSMDERAAFIEDYHQTQACSLLRFIKEHRPCDVIDTEKGTVTSSTIDYALNKVKDMIRTNSHCSIDEAPAKVHTPSELVENKTFMMESAKVLHMEAKFKVAEKVMAEYKRLAIQYINQVEALRNDFRWDGSRNLWILKPGYQSRGIGIVIRSCLDEILQWASQNQNRRYIAQKYIGE